MVKLDLILKANCNKVIQMSNIHSLAFGAKIEAAKEAFKQCKNVCYKALSIVEKGGHE